MLKNNYSSLQFALQDIKNIVNDGEQKVAILVTNEFIKHNDKNMAKDTGSMASDVQNDTDYKHGVVIANAPYARFVFFGTENKDGTVRMKAGGNTGKPDPFNYTYNEIKDDLAELVIKTYDELL